jgi:hypothetical protein
MVTGMELFTAFFQKWQVLVIALKTNTHMFNNSFYVK